MVLHNHASSLPSGNMLGFHVSLSNALSFMDTTFGDGILNIPVGFNVNVQVLVTVQSASEGIFS